MDKTNKTPLEENRKTISIERGYDSFCDNHGSGYWKIVFINLRRQVNHGILTYNNDLKISKKYHCFIDYGGCIGLKTFDTDIFKEAMEWMRKKLNKYI